MNSIERSLLITSLVRDISRFLNAKVSTKTSQHLPPLLHITQHFLVILKLPAYMLKLRAAIPAESPALKALMSELWDDFADVLGIYSFQFIPKQLEEAKFCNQVPQNTYLQRAFIAQGQKIDILRKIRHSKKPILQVVLV